MKRKDFMLKMLAALPATSIAMNLTELKTLAGSLEATPKMPVLFLGHGSPMNAIEENKFVQGFRKISNGIESPKAILCISAHWETQGTKVTAMQNPRTIHDFGGFPKTLYEVQYPAPGNPQLAKEVSEISKTSGIQLDESWGLDHGAWSVIKHMYPQADVPVIQLSLDYAKTPQQHYELAKELTPLRSKGILIVGSGNLVHNLGAIDWRKLNESYAFDWAKEASAKMNRFILNGDHQNLIAYKKHGKAFELAIPTPEHYLPLLYVLALQQKNETVYLFNDEPLGGSLTMTSVRIG